MSGSLLFLISFALAVLVADELLINQFAIIESHVLCTVDSFNIFTCSLTRLLARRCHNVLDESKYFRGHPTACSPWSIFSFISAGRFVIITPLSTPNPSRNRRAVHDTFELNPADARAEIRTEIAFLVVVYDPVDGRVRLKCSGRGMGCGEGNGYCEGECKEGLRCLAAVRTCSVFWGVEGAEDRRFRCGRGGVSFSPADLGDADLLCGEKDTEGWEWLSC